MKFSKILIANRGEIAVRVIRTAKDLGFRTVAVFSDADKFAPHTQMADEAVYIGASQASESYLKIDKIIAAAKASGADAIHPGYGFLSENAKFAQACQHADITFIGPSSAAIELMGSKRLAKIAMIAAGVPCIPGYQDSHGDTDDVLLIEKAKEIGFPVMIKASAGGGGRGMRLVDSENNMASALKSARSESMNAFGSSELILEKALTGARHIEIQIFADTFGNVIHLGERDCSLQRRHQKVVEESPSMAVSESLRARMGAAAVLAAKACNYVGAGTVEYLLDADIKGKDDGNFYFLEMNTRLQVEHPVTELVTGLDLVAWQLNIANGEKLPLTQAQVSLRGHAMEVRLYAEDPSDNFMPQTGNILLWQPALTNLQSQQSIAGVRVGSGLRVDSGIEQGQTVSPFYDPMLVKLIAYGDNREQARRRLIRLVQDSQLLGVRDNRSFLCQLLSDQNFIDGKASTDYIGECFTENKSLAKQVVSLEEWCLAALLMDQQNSYKSPFKSSSKNKDSLQTAFVGERLLTLNQGKELTKGLLKENQINIAFSKRAKNKFEVACKAHDWCQQIELLTISETKISYFYAGVRKSRTFVFDNNPANPTLWLSSTEGNLVFSEQSLTAKNSESAGSDQVVASMDGVVVDVLVKEGVQVKSGDVVAVIEAMKMEHLLKASLDGTIEKISVCAGDQVQARQLIAQLAIK